jgi:hypothetical protein
MRVAAGLVDADEITGLGSEEGAMMVKRGRMVALILLSDVFGR